MIQWYGDLQLPPLSSSLQEARLAYSEAHSFSFFLILSHSFSCFWDLFGLELWKHGPLCPSIWEHGRKGVTLPVSALLLKVYSQAKLWDKACSVHQELKNAGAIQTSEEYIINHQWMLCNWDSNTFHWTCSQNFLEILKLETRNKSTTQRHWKLFLRCYSWHCNLWSSYQGSCPRYFPVLLIQNFSEILGGGSRSGTTSIGTGSISGEIVTLSPFRIVEIWWHLGLLETVRSRSDSRL